MFAYFSTQTGTKLQIVLSRSTPGNRELGLDRASFGAVSRPFVLLRMNEELDARLLDVDSDLSYWVQIE